jgi:hypothetical protein
VCVCFFFFYLFNKPDKAIFFLFLLLSFVFVRSVVAEWADWQHTGEKEDNSKGEKQEETPLVSHGQHLDPAASLSSLSLLVPPPPNPPPSLLPLSLIHTRRMPPLCLNACRRLLSPSSRASPMLSETPPPFISTPPRNVHDPPTPSPLHITPTHT